MKKILLVFGFLIAANTALGAESYNYINPKLISPQFISEPRPNGSDELVREVADIKKLQSDALPADIAAAQNESDYRPELVSDIWLNGHEATAVLVKKVNADCDTITRAAKDYWHITRPYLADSDIRALVTTPGKSYAYPSGHTACSLVTAEVLSQLLPGQHIIFITRANEIAEHRVLAGMHWFQDLAGGRELGLLIFGALQMSPEYQRDFKKAALEWK